MPRYIPEGRIYVIDEAKHRSGNSFGTLHRFEGGGKVEFDVRDPQREMGGPDAWGKCAIILEIQPTGAPWRHKQATKIKIVPCPYDD